MHDHAHQHDHDHAHSKTNDLRQAIQSSGTECCELHGSSSAEGAIVFALIGGALVLTTIVAGWLNYEESIRQIPAALGAILLWIPLLKSAYTEIRKGRPSSAFLVALAIGAALATNEYVTAGLLAFILFMMDKVLERTAWGAHRAIEELVGLTPDTARRIREDGTEENASLDDLKVGDTVRIRPGENMPADGVILAGTTTINQASLTGEAAPVEAEKNDQVYAGTTNLTGGVDVRITRLGTETTIGKVVTLINEAERSKTPRQQIIEQVAKHYVWIVLMMSLAVWILSPKGDGDPNTMSPIAKAISVLVVTCPGALLLSSPTAMVAAFAAAARLGVMVKSTSTLETAAGIDAVILDKTGTVTTGRFAVSRLAPAEGVEGAALLEAAATVEQHSNHPLAQAIVETARAARITPATSQHAEEFHGLGVRVASPDDPNRFVCAGRAKWLVDLIPGVAEQVQAVEQRIEGMTGVHVIDGDHYLGAVGLEDKVRSRAAHAVATMRDLGVRWIGLLTGDRLAVASRVGQAVNVDHIEAECHPEEKHAIVMQLTQSGRRVMMVGDGINDGPSLAAADVGVAMGLGGTDIAANSAGIALMNDDLSRLPFMIQLARKTKTVVAQNIVASILIAIIGLALAASGSIDVWFAAVYHSLADIFVIANSFRLVRFGEEFIDYVGGGAPSQPILSDRSGTATLTGQDGATPDRIAPPATA
ncbi:MAG: cation-translocating P-type ATPase [Planctomycetes bacterium]|nr:cation-translocating P-type ATPase [Planctomycetota bacterium]